VALKVDERLKRVFNIDVERCRVCGAKARVIAAIEDKAIIDKITIGRCLILSKLFYS